jgi:uncharacterized paraquat-inducible protein A
MKKENFRKMDELVSIEELRSYLKRVKPQEPYIDKSLNDFYCPHCETLLWKNQPYCHVCGQAIRWGKKEEV